MAADTKQSTPNIGGNGFIWLLLAAAGTYFVAHQLPLEETLKHWAEIDMLHVPYKTVPVALNDVLAGRVSMMFADLTTGLPHVKAARCVH